MTVADLRALRSAVPNHETREAWLMAAVAMQRRTIDLSILLMDDAPKEIAFPDINLRVGRHDEAIPALPTNLRVACSNPSGGIRNRVRGECVYPQSSADGSFEIWISPKIDDVETVLCVLLHELIHATLENWERGAGHGKRFWRLAKVLGFSRPLTTATIATDDAGRNLRSLLTSGLRRLATTRTRALTSRRMTRSGAGSQRGCSRLSVWPTAAGSRCALRALGRSAPRLCARCVRGWACIAARWW